MVIVIFINVREYVVSKINSRLDFVEERLVVLDWNGLDGKGICGLGLVFCEVNFLDLRKGERR